MGPKIRIFFWLLTAIFFGYDLYLWGGLEATPVIGKELMKEAPFQSPLAATYMYLGSKVNGTLGKSDSAREFAARRFPDKVMQAEDPGNVVVQRFLAAQSIPGTVMYYGAPLLLVLSLVLHMRRQKPIRSFGGQT